MSSDTPRTDAKYKENWSPFNEDQAVECLANMRDFARELERENAALRADKEHLFEQLSEANRLLRAFAPESARAAIDAARKERFS